MTCAVLQLECICDGRRHTHRGLHKILFPDLRSLRQQEPWIAEITGWSGERPERRFLQGVNDYSHADDLGERGIMKCFVLEPDRVYEVKEQISWIAERRYFARVEAGRVVEITRDEVEACLSARSAPTS